MSIGIDTALGVAALSLTCLHGCIKGLTVLSKAVHYDRDTSNIRLQIELEQHRLFTWAEAAGLTEAPPTLHMSVDNAAFVPRILNQLEVLLSDLGQLKNRYQLKLKATSQVVNAIDDEDSALSKLGPKALASIQRASAVIFSRRKTSWPKLRWITLDEKEVGRLLREVRSYTSHLENFLVQTSQSKLHRDLEASLREMVLNLDDRRKLSIFGCESGTASSTATIAATARLKQIRLKLEALESSSSGSPVCPSATSKTSVSDPGSQLRLSCYRRTSDISLQSMRLHMRFLTIPDITSTHVHRCLAYYDGELVVLEWRGGEWFDATSLEKRVDRVAAFLHQLEPSFHSLPCRGYVKDVNSNRYGYVFDLPKCQFSSPAQYSPQEALSASPLSSLWTLRDLFTHTDYILPLNERLLIATTLLETLLNLHTTGWLHKQLSSENIIFVQTGADAKKIAFSAQSMYVAGYAYARADEAGEMTEPLVSDIDADLYRHPASMGKSRVAFRRNFDIFSVGCTLLEIGLCSSLRNILEYHSTETASRNGVLQGSAVPLSHSPSMETVAETVNDEKERGRRNLDSSLDLLKLRYELLLVPVSRHDRHDKEATVKENALPRKYPCKILQSLAGATGDKYTRIVEKLLSAEGIYGTGQNAGDEDKEYALDLELEALNTIKGIAETL